MEEKHNENVTCVAVATAGTFSGKLYLGCYGDDSWHAGPSEMQAIAVDKVVATTAP